MVARLGTSWHRKRDVRVLSVENPRTKPENPFNQTEQAEVFSEYRQREETKRSQFVVDEKVSETTIPEEEVLKKRKKSQYTKSLSLEISSDMHKTLKILALEQDDTLNSIVIEALKQFLRNDEQMNLKAEALRKRLS